MRDKDGNTEALQTPRRFYKAASVAETGEGYAVRLAFTALDAVAGARAPVAAEVARYAGSDMLCYFADHPTPLVERQVKGWGAILQWAEEDLQLPLVRTTGIIHVTQPAETLLRVARLADALDDFSLAGLAHATSLVGSAILALALQRDKLERGFPEGATAAPDPGIGGAP